MNMTKPTLFGSSKNLTSCPLLDKVPSEIRVKIYGFIFFNSGDKLAAPADHVKDRRIRWRPRSKVVPTSTGASGVVNTSSIAPRDRRRHRNSLDTSILRTCKLIYEESHFELVSKSIVISQIGDVNQIVQYPTLLAHICHIEIRDGSYSTGRQLLGRRGSRRPQVLDRQGSEALPPNLFGPIHRRNLGITHLRWIRNLVEKAPMLARVVIGFEVLLVNDPQSYSSLEGGDIDSQVLGMSVESGFGLVDCVKLGVWRFLLERFDGIEIRHFNVVAAFERLIRDPCDCHNYRGNFVRAMLVNDHDIVMRHFMGRDGVLGEEAEKRCGGGQIVRPLNMFEKTFFLLEGVVKNGNNF